jgi:hypothetical protein
MKNYHMAKETLTLALKQGLTNKTTIAAVLAVVAFTLSAFGIHNLSAFGIHSA